MDHCRTEHEFDPDTQPRTPRGKPLRCSRSGQAILQRLRGRCLRPSAALPVTFGPYGVDARQRNNEIVRHGRDLPPVLDVEVTTQGQVPAVDDYVREKIGGLTRLTHQPVLRARVALRRRRCLQFALVEATLAPSLKVKRAVVAGRYTELLDSFYL
jgi:hypothetical protein